jgi:YHS domain-containing protein
MTHTSDIVEQFFAAFWGGDSQTARHYLADDLSFAGPAATFTGADVFLKASEHAWRAVKEVEKHKVFVDGPEVCIFYRLRIDGPVSSAEVAAWYCVDGNKICSIRMILDTAPFITSTRQQPREQPGETALDPVCHMTVEKASAAATRSHAGSTYYFCSPGCAEAFDQEPEKYLASSR